MLTPGRASLLPSLKLQGCTWGRLLRSLGVVKHMTTLIESKEFEQLVAHIEQAAVPRGAVVKWNEYIPDIQTGTPRQCDVTIRYKIGTVDILVVIEARKRKKKDDVSWLGELKERRDAVGASKIIGVSSSGFSKELLRKAELSAIELRTLAEVTPSDIEAWFLPPGGTVHVFRLVEEVLCAFYLVGPNGQPEMEPLGVIDSEMPVFYHNHVASPFSTSVFFQLLELHDPKAFQDIPLDGTKTKLGFTVTFPRGDLWVISNDVQSDVHQVVISGLVSYQSAVCPLEDGQHYLYSAHGGEAIQHSIFTAELMDMQVRFDHQSSGSAGEGKVSATFLQKNQTAGAQQFNTPDQKGRRFSK